MADNHVFVWPIFFDVFSKDMDIEITKRRA